MIYTGKRVMDGEMELGDFTVLISTLFQFGGQVLSIITSLSQMANGYMAVNQLSELLNCPTRRKVVHTDISSAQFTLMLAGTFERRAAPACALKGIHGVLSACLSPVLLMLFWDYRSRTQISIRI